MNLIVKICAWCRKDLGTVTSEFDTLYPISHGICQDCMSKILSYRAKNLRRYLDGFDGPVLVVDSAGLVVTANSKALLVFNKEARDIEGRPGGDAIECKHARLPEGCGNTVHCRTCAIRRTVMDTMETGKSHIKVPAYADLHDVTNERKVRFLISTEKAGEIVFLRIDEMDAAD